MATQKIIVKTARARKGTVSRAAIRRAVETVFGASKPTRKTRTANATVARRDRASVLQAQ